MKGWRTGGVMARRNIRDGDKSMGRSLGASGPQWLAHLGTWAPLSAS